MTDTAPRLKAPPGTCDTHMHIYDARFPTAPTAAFTPPDASVADYLRVRARLGITRTVVVQPSTYGTDNSCTLAAIAALGDSARGVAVVDQTVTDAELERLTKAGIRGIRLTNPADVEKGIAEALAHDGPVLVDAVVNRTELVMPPSITLEMAKGFTLYMVKAVISGRGDEVIDLARSNLWR